jgi:hypothetical protein
MKTVALGEKNRIRLPDSVIPSGVVRFLIEKDETGRIILTPVVDIPFTQTYFWSKKWQEDELQINKHLQKGEYTDGSVDDVMKAIHKRKHRKK